VRPSTAKSHRALFARVGAPLVLVWACLPEDDLQSYSRAWTSEPEALLPAPPAVADGGAALPSVDAGASPSPGSMPSPPGPPGADDAGVPRADAGVPLDAGPDAALSITDANADPARLDDGGATSDAGP
jgi:hypothetical protein